MTPSASFPVSATAEAALTEALRILYRLGYCQDAVADCLGEQGLSAVAGRSPAAAVWALHRRCPEFARSPLGPGDHSAERLMPLVVSAVYLRQPHGLGEFRALFTAPVVADMVEAGVLSPLGPADGPLYRLRVDIRPVSSPHHGDTTVLMCSDPDASFTCERPGPDHVPGVGNAPLSLLSAIPRRPGRRILDLGCGSGVLGLVLASDGGAGDDGDTRVIGTDIHPRALMYARINAKALFGTASGAGPGVSAHREARVVDLGSGRPTGTLGAEPTDSPHAELLPEGASPEECSPSFVPVELREGSWFDPVDGETFDTVVCNPPFVMGPPVVDHVYRDSGLALDGASELVVSRVPDVLRPGGTAHLLVSWVLTEGETPGGHVGRWLPSEGIRAWLHVRSRVSPVEYVQTWVADESLDARSAAGSERTRRWLEYFSEHQVDSIGIGWLHLQRVEGPTELTVELLDHPLPPGADLGAEVREWCLRAEWLAAAGPATIVESSYAVRPGVALEDVSVADTGTGQGFTPLRRRLSRTDGPAWSHEVDPTVCSILAGLHPDGLSLGEVVELLCAARGWDAAALTTQVVPIAVDLVRHGIIVPAELLAAGLAEGT